MLQVQIAGVVESEDLRRLVLAQAVALATVVIDVDPQGVSPFAATGLWGGSVDGWTRSWWIRERRNSRRRRWETWVRG